MESISELIKLVTQKRVKKIELFDETSRNKSSNYFKLFDGIHSETYDSDEEAASDIYNCLPSEKKYLILKTRLKQKLLNTLFFVEHDKNETSVQKQMELEAKKSVFYTHSS